MKRSELLLMVLQVPVDFVLLLLAGISAYQLRFTDWAIELKPIGFKISLLQYIDILTPVIIGWLIIFALTGLYSTDPNRKLGRDLTRIILACSTGVAAVALYVMFAQQLFDSRFLVAASWVFAIVYISLGRILMRGLKGLMYRFGFGLRRVVVIGSEEITEAIIETLKKRKELGYKILQIFDKFDPEAEKKLNKIKFDEMFFTNPRADEKEALQALNFCNQHHKVFKYSADLFATLSTNIQIVPLAGVPIVEMKPTRLGAWGRVLKRLFDIVIGLIMIILLSPFMLITSLIILIETGRPIIYKNERVGIRGHKFLTLKFRSMYQKDSTGPQFGKSGKAAEEKEKELIKSHGSKEGPIYKVVDDPRVTPVGRFIRRWSIDEFPQFFNVLSGSMSIVGPRPHQPREVEKYEKQFPIVFTLKPGITGLAQISGRSDLAFEEEMKLDILYTEKWSLMLDLIIFVKTPFVLFKRREVL